MKTAKNGQNFLVLVPHRDTRGILYKENISGAYTFPLVAPLASLSKPLSADELKHTARSLRKANGMDKFNLTDLTSAAFPTGYGEMDLFGLCLKINIPEITGSAVQKIIKIFSPLVIGTCLIPKDNKEQVHFGSCGLCSSWLNSSPEISFRAAAIANMYWQPAQRNNEKGFKWKIGKLVWLPKVTKVAKENLTAE